MQKCCYAHYNSKQIPIKICREDFGQKLGDPTDLLELDGVCGRDSCSQKGHYFPNAAGRNENVWFVQQINCTCYYRVESPGESKKIIDSYVIKKKAGVNFFWAF